jgi:hypothetical protein
MTKAGLALVASAAMLLLAACSADSTPTTPAATPTTDGSTSPTSSREAAPEPSTEQGMAETRARFTAGNAEIIVRIADNPTSRDFVSMLPLTLDFEDFAGREKISDLPRELTTEGSTGTAPANGDLTYFVPWGNLPFFYNSDETHDDRLIPIGTVETGYELLDDLEAGPVTVELID